MEDGSNKEKIDKSRYDNVHLNVIDLNKYFNNVKENRKKIDELVNNVSPIYKKEFNWSNQSRNDMFINFFNTKLMMASKTTL